MKQQTRAEFADGERKDKHLLSSIACYACKSQDSVGEMDTVLWVGKRSLLAIDEALLEIGRRLGTAGPDVGCLYSELRVCIHWLTSAAAW